MVPREWLLENNARLLILSGNNICFTFMASKAVNGRAIELARLIVFLALVSKKINFLLPSCLTFIVDLSGSCPEGIELRTKHFERISIFKSIFLYTMGTPET